MEIEPCPCGAPAQLAYVGDRRFYISCSEPQCWMGPTCDTREQAIAAWNRVAGQRWRPIETAPEDRRGLIIHVKPGVGATHWRPALEPPEPPPIETSGYIEIIWKEPLTEGDEK